MNTGSKALKIAVACLVVMAMVCVSGFARDKYETIDATAYGTSTQLGANVGVTIIIYEFSTPETRQALIEAFQKGQNQGLVDALQKMKAVGRIQIPGTVGYDLAYAVSVPTASGRTVRFVTNRRIAFQEAYRNTQSQAYNPTGGEINVVDEDNSKSAGVLYPAAQLVINKDGDLQIELRQNPWRLTNVIVRGKTEN